MGMAASQARLLTLTARLHDVELSAQFIESQKIALATQKDGVYENYMEALDKTKITVAYWNSDATYDYINANFSSVCTYQEDRNKQYALRNNRTGRIYATKEEKEAYESCNDKYSFAWQMCGFNESNFGYSSPEMYKYIGIGTTQCEYGRAGSSSYCNDNTLSLYMTEVEAKVYEEHKGDEGSKLESKYQDILDAENEPDETKRLSMMKKALDAFRDELYAKYSNEIFDEMNINKNAGEDGACNTYEGKSFADIKEKFNHYVHLWETIHDAGGCEEMDANYYSGDQGDTWFNNMVKTGLATILVYDDKDTLNPKWEETSVATSINSNFLKEEQDDKDVKKAEAEYEHEMDLINRKDKKFDMELSKLETERTAITTEMDSIKKVRDDNTDRTFGIFS